MTTTDLSETQHATILSALDDAPRSPANKGEALRAIGRSARGSASPPTTSWPARPACSMAAEPGRLRVELHDLAGRPHRPRRATGRHGRAGG